MISRFVEVLKARSTSLIADFLLEITFLRIGPLFTSDLIIKSSSSLHSFTIVS